MHTSSPAVPGAQVTQSHNSPMSEPWRESTQVNTRPAVATLMCSLSGYPEAREPWSLRVLEPAAGTGELLRPVIRHLVEAVREAGIGSQELGPAVRAYELDTVVAATLRANLTEWLSDGLGSQAAKALVDEWVVEGDFLLEDAGGFDVVLTNPPYLQMAKVPLQRRASYVEKWSTLSGRADVYVGFLEASLRALDERGVAVVLAPDRWMRSGYGEHLRRLVAREFSIEQVLSIADREAFQGRVLAYPTLSVIRRAAPQGDMRLGAVGKRSDGELTSEYLAPLPAETVRAHQERGRYWPTWTISPPSLPPTWRPLEDTGVTVRTGVATGRDAAFVVDHDDPNLERIPPVFLRTAVRARDISVDGVADALPSLIDPDRPANSDDRRALAEYLTSLEADLSRRECDGPDGRKWWRLIDRVRENDVAAPKLLLPDLRGHLIVAKDDSGRVPLHGVTYLMSTAWDLEVLGGILISDIVAGQLRAYSPAVSGAAYRVAGHYVKALVIPRFGDLEPAEQGMLRSAFRARDAAAATATVSAISRRLAIAT